MKQTENGKNSNIYAHFSSNSDMPRLKGQGKPVPSADPLPLEEVLSQLTKSQREKIISGYDIKTLAKVFEDGVMVKTALAFLENGMNVSKTARILYMHRNTLMYKLNAIWRQTGLDLRRFDMAVTFALLHTLYIMK